MTLLCKYEELDDDTREYLRAVRNRRGRRTPGIYVPISNTRPLVAFLVGPLVAFLMIAASLGSSKDAWAVAMLQTAGLLIGGWCIAYALRRWLGLSKSYGGTFAFFDPLNAYQVNGETVTVTGLRSVRGVEADGNNVWFDLTGQERTIPVGTMLQARRVEDYYAAMGDLEKQEDGPWQSAPPAELGAAARMTMEDDVVPRTVEHLDLDLEKIPTEPARTNRAGLGLLGLLLIPVAGIGLFLLLSAVNRPLGDELAFESAKADGAPGLRGYLLDERNTRKRDEAKQLLSQLYAAPIQRLNGPPPAQNPELRQGMVKLLEMLRTSETPAVAIDVKDEGGDTTNTIRANDLRREVADGLARAIGPTLIAFAEPPAGQPAHVTIRYKVKPDQLNNATATVDIEIRTALDQPPVASASWDAVATPAPINSVPNALKVAICLQLVGIYTPAPPPDFGGGDF